MFEGASRLLRRIFNRGAAKAQDATVAIAIESEQVTLATFSRDPSGPLVVRAWASEPAVSAGQRQAVIQEFVDSHDLKGQICRCVLAPEDYSLRLIERPANVTSDELVDATRWVLRDLIEFDVEEAELALCEIPENESRARTPRMFAVAVRNEIIFDHAHAIDATGLILGGFEVVETAMLALENRLAETVAGAALMRIDDKNSTLTLSNDGHLYLARNIHVDTDSIEEAARVASDDPENGIGESMRILDGMLLDVQRSLDFFESEYGQAPASRLTLLPAAVDVEPLLPTLAETFRPMKIEALSLEQIIEFDSSPPSIALPSLSLAVGAIYAGPEPIGDTLVPHSIKARNSGFGLASLGRLTGAIAAVLIGYAIFSEAQIVKQTGVRDELLDRKIALTDQLAAESERAALIAARFDPVARIEALTKERDGGLAMLRDIGDRNAATDASFSSVLNALARQDIEGVWLDRIRISGGGTALTLSGRSLVPEDVPTFMKRLGTEPSFKSRLFRVFEMTGESETDAGVGFVIATERNTDDAGGRSE